MANSIYIRSQTGDYVLQNGYPLNAPALLTKMYFLLATPKGSYLYDPAMGNSLLNDNPPFSNEQIIQGINNALKILNDNKEILGLDIKILIKTLNYYNIQIDCIDNTKQQVKFHWVYDAINKQLQFK